MWVLVPWPRIKPRPPLGAWNFYSRRTTRELFPLHNFYYSRVIVYRSMPSLLSCPDDFHPYLQTCVSNFYVAPCHWHFRLNLWKQNYALPTPSPPTRGGGAKNTYTHVSLQGHHCPSNCIRWEFSFTLLFHPSCIFSMTDVFSVIYFKSSLSTCLPLSLSGFCCILVFLLTSFHCEALWLLGKLNYAFISMLHKAQQS